MASSALNLRKPVEQPLWGELYSELTSIVYPSLPMAKPGQAPAAQISSQTTRSDDTATGEICRLKKNLLVIDPNRHVMHNAS
jgi:hypothetical protein